MSQAFGKELKKLPDTPGVYFFLGKSRKILYIGRATSLRNRVRSYFAPNLAEKRSSWLAKMLPLIRSIDFRKTDSVLEAILLEADLIKKFKPPFNTDEKDDKSFNCVVITKESFPSVCLARSRDVDFSSLRIKDKGLRILSVYGPYPAGFQLQTAMKIVRKIFPYRDLKCTACHSGKAQPYTGKVEPCRPCFNRQIGLCPGTCIGEITTTEYAKTIRNLRLFFEGKKARLLKLLEREMKAAARKQEFERAGELKRQLFALRHIQDIALLKRELVSASVPRSRSASVQRTVRVEAFDLSHFGGTDIVGAMAVVENGAARRSEYRLFKLRSIKGPHETAGLQEILRRRFGHPEWPRPQLIVVDGNEVQKRATEAVLAELGQNIPVVAVVKDERHRPRDLIGFRTALQPRLSASNLRPSALLANSEAHRFVLRFQRKRRYKSLFQ